MTEPARNSPLLDAETDVVRALAEAASIADATHDVLAALAVRLGWDVAILWTANDAAGLLRCSRSWSAEDPDLVEFRRRNERLTFGRDVGLPGRVWSTGEPLWIAEFGADSGFPRADLAARFGVRTAAAVPVPKRGGVAAVIELLSRTVRPPDPGHLRVLVTVGHQLAHYLARVRAEDRLHESEERAATIVEAALDCVITIDHRGVVLEFNPAAEAVFGYSRDEAVGRELAELIVPPALREAHRAGLRRYLATTEPRVLNRRLELEAMRADGTSFPVELTVTRAGPGEPPVYAGFLRDITARRAAESERRRLVKEAVASRARAEAARVRAEAAQAEAEIERRRLAFLAHVGLRMAASMDYATTLQEVARAAVPDLADLCAVSVLEPTGLRAVALAHADRAGECVARELLGRYAPDVAPWPGAGAVIRSGQPELLPEITEERLVAAAVDEDHLRLLRELGPRSSLTLPIRASGRTLGVITLLSGESGRPFGDADLVVATALAARAGLHIDNARLYTERSRIADTLQRSLLPAALPAIPGVEIAAHYSAAGDQNEVGGDFYDVFASGEGVWTAIIGDVSGKGAAAAAVTALARHTLYAAAVRGRSPARNLAFLNDVMRRRVHHPAAFCTVVYARVCPSPGSATVTLASGGHPPPLVLRADGSVERVDAAGTLVGMLADARFRDRELRLSVGDLLLLYTDGAVELRRSDLSFGERELERVLRKHAGRPAEEVVENVARRVQELQTDERTDDVALLALRVAPAPERGHG